MTRPINGECPVKMNNVQEIPLMTGHVVRSFDYDVSAN